MRRSLKLFVLGVSLAVVGVTLAKSFSHLPCTLLSGASTLTIKLADLAPGTVRAFCYRDRAGRQLRFLLARDAAGQVHTVFDACGQCYKFHKGYSYSHGYLVCRLCGNRYSLIEMNAGKASCVPVRLDSMTGRDQARIRVADVKAGKWLF